MYRSEIKVLKIYLHNMLVKQWNLCTHCR